MNQSQSKKHFTVIRPKSHDAWLNERKKGIGASECGKIIGCSRYGSAYQLWRDKLGINPPVVENWAMLQGHIFEEHIAKTFQEEIGKKVIKASKGDWLAVDRQHSFLRVSPDWTYWTGESRKDDGKGILECKSSRNNYTEDCLSGECLSWYCQVQYQLYVMGYKEAYLGFLCTDTGDHWFRKIDYDATFTEGTLIPSIINFWTKYVDPAQQVIREFGIDHDRLEQYTPPLTSADDVKDRYPQHDPDKTVIATSDLIWEIEEYTMRRDQIKGLEEKQKATENKIKLLMLDAESIVESPGSKPLVTFKTNKPSVKLDYKAIEKECPSFCQRYYHTVPGARVFKIK